MIDRMDEEKYVVAKESVSITTPKGIQVELMSASKDVSELCEYALRLLQEVEDLNGHKTGGSYTG